MYTLNLKKLNGAMDLIEAKQTKTTIQSAIYNIIINIIIYQQFYLAHEEHHSTLIEESDIVSSEYYLQNVQKMYTLNLKKLNGAMDLIEAKQTKTTIQSAIEQDSRT